MDENGKGKKEKIVLFLCIIATACVTAFLIIYAVPFFSKTIAGWGNSEILSAITMTGVIVAFSVPFIGGRYQKKIELERREYEERKKEENFKSLYQIDIHVTVLENRTVLFSASIENVGDKTIITKSSNLYIDEGIEDPKGSKIDIEDGGRGAGMTDSELLKMLCQSIDKEIEETWKDRQALQDDYTKRASFRWNDGKFYGLSWVRGQIVQLTGRSEWE